MMMMMMIIIMMIIIMVTMIINIKQNSHRSHFSSLWRLPWAHRLGFTPHELEARRNFAPSDMENRIRQSIKIIPLII